MRKLTIFWATLFLMMPALANSNEVAFKLRGGYFYPSDKDFRDIYGSGLKSGLEISTEVARNLELWIEAGYFAKKGELSFTEETTKLHIVPVGGGIKYLWPVKRLAFYTGAGVLYYRFREVSPLGTVDWGRPGLVIETGSSIRLTGKLSGDIFIRYSYCRMKPADFSFGIGGYDLGIGLAYEY
jgi:hypothetical protein